MGEFPYHHDKKPDASRRWELRRAAPILAVAAAGLAIGSFFETGHNGRNSDRPISPQAEFHKPSCQAETEWRGLPKSTDWHFLAALLRVSDGQAEAAKMAVVDCDEGITPMDILNTPIDVEGQDGPCLPLDFLADVKTKNPFERHKEIFAVCAGQETIVFDSETSHRT